MIRAEMYEIIPCPQGRLAIMPRPRGGDWLKGEMASLKNTGVTELVSMLTPEEEVELLLQDEEKICAEVGLGFHRHPVPDHSVPTQPGFDEFVSSLLPRLTAGGFIAIHCRAGIGRSAVALAALLGRLGVSATDAIALISHARGWDVPETDEQFDFIHGLGQKTTG